eukprot:8764309-Heterocapsa_arctica.AAC.1
MVPACPGELFSSCFKSFLGTVQSTGPVRPPRSLLLAAAFFQTDAVACRIASCWMSFGESSLRS